MGVHHSQCYGSFLVAYACVFFLDIPFHTSRSAYTAADELRARRLLSEFLFDRKKGRCRLRGKTKSQRRDKMSNGSPNRNDSQGRRSSFCSSSRRLPRYRRTFIGYAISFSAWIRMIETICRTAQWLLTK